MSYRFLQVGICEYLLNLTDVSGSSYRCNTVRAVIRCYRRLSAGAACSVLHLKDASPHNVVAASPPTQMTQQVIKNHILQHILFFVPQQPITTPLPRGRPAHMKLSETH